MPRRSDDYMKARRRQILEAARSCVVAQGWSQTTIDDVAEAAGLSKGAVYNHFARKQDLLLGLIEQNLEDIETAAEDDSFEGLSRKALSGLALLAGPDGVAIARGQLEFQIEGERDVRSASLIEKGANRVIELYSGVIGKLRPDLRKGDARLQALRMFFVMQGMLMVRAMTESVSETDMRGVIEGVLADIAGPRSR